MAFEEGGLTISGGGSDIGVAEEQLPCAFTGEPLVIAFNPGYLKDGLGAIHTDRVVFGFTQPSRPGQTAPTGENQESPGLPGGSTAPSTTPPAPAPGMGETGSMVSPGPGSSGPAAGAGPTQ